jgi:hypothetical protein
MFEVRRFVFGSLAGLATVSIFSAVYVLATAPLWMRAMKVYLVS